MIPRDGVKFNWLLTVGVVNISCQPKINRDSGRSASWSISPGDVLMKGVGRNVERPKRLL